MELVGGYMIRLPMNCINNRPKNKNKPDIPKMVLGHYKKYEHKMFALKCYYFKNF